MDKHDWFIKRWQAASHSFLGMALRSSTRVWSFIHSFIHSVSQSCIHLTFVSWDGVEIFHSNPRLHTDPTMEHQCLLVHDRRDRKPFKAFVEQLVYSLVVLRLEDTKGRHTKADTQGRHTKADIKAGIKADTQGRHNRMTTHTHMHTRKHARIRTRTHAHWTQQEGSDKRRKGMVGTPIYTNPLI